MEQPSGDSKKQEAGQSSVHDPDPAPYPNVEGGADSTRAKDESEESETLVQQPVHHNITGDHNVASNVHENGSLDNEKPTLDETRSKKSVSWSQELVMESTFSPSPAPSSRSASFKGESAAFFSLSIYVYISEFVHISTFSLSFA